MKLERVRPQIVYHPDASLLPPGFKFPKAYLDYVNQDEIVRIYPWSFMCHAKKTGYYDAWIGILKSQYPDRQLVPFAKWNLDDDVACFEPGEDPDLPVIHYIHLRIPAMRNGAACRPLKHGWKTQ